MFRFSLERADLAAIYKLDKVNGRIGLRCQPVARSRPFQCLRTHSCPAQLRPLAQHPQVAQHEQRVQLLGQSPVPASAGATLDRHGAGSDIAQVTATPRTAG